MKPILPKNTVINELFEIKDEYLFNFNHKYIKIYT